MLSEAGQPPGSSPLVLLRRESRSLVQRLRLWTPARYAALVPGTGLRRADVVHHLAQDFADAASAYESGDRRVLPRLPGDLVLADQLAVTADDLVRAGPPASAALSATAHLLAHRVDLLDEAVPPGLAAALGLDDVVTAGRAACSLGP
ncbi:MAG: hypothetical protein JWN88_2735 [Frankiales bacterium]|jgi:hypothetical protein|nr:hypothetical protein [Frankiales bacterium]